MSTNEIISLVVQLVIVVAAFIFGRCILPKYKDEIENANQWFQVLLNYAESFVAYARQFLNDYSGEEKMDSVVEKLGEVCEKFGIDVDQETLRAIGQKAYDAMKAGEVETLPIILEQTAEEFKDFGTESDSKTDNTKENVTTLEGTTASDNTYDILHNNEN